MLEGIAVGWLDLGAGSIVVLVILLILTDKLWTERRAKAAIAAALDNANQVLGIVTKQRDDVMEALRESHEVARINAESVRDLTDSVEKLSDGQEVAVNLIRAALPAPVRSES